MERATTLIRRFGRLVHDLRAEAGLTQTELARRAGMSVKHLGDVERGDVEPSLSAIDCLARALETSLLELLAPLVASSSTTRPTLPMRDWLQAREVLQALGDYADRMAVYSRTTTTPRAEGARPPGRRRTERRTARPPRRAT